MNTSDNDSSKKSCIYFQDLQTVMSYFQKNNSHIQQTTPSHSQDAGKKERKTEINSPQTNNSKFTSPKDDSIEQIDNKQIAQELFKKILEELKLPWDCSAERIQFDSQVGTSTTLKSINHSSESEDESVFSLDLTDDPLIGSPKNDSTSCSSGSLPALSQFWPNKSAQYWIISGEHLGGRELCECLPKLLQDRTEVKPSSTVGLLFYHAEKTNPLCVLDFTQETSPTLHRCENIEDELYGKKKTSDDRRLLLVPSEKLPENQLVILTPPIRQIGILNKSELFWSLNVIPEGNERVAFFEDGLTPTLLRNSPALETLAERGRLYIIYCAWTLLENKGMESDMNSPKIAARKMFATQAETLCPKAWRRLVLKKTLVPNSRKKENLGALLKDLLTPWDESAVYLLKKYVMPDKLEERRKPFACKIQDAVLSEMKLAYLGAMPHILQNIKNGVAKQLPQDPYICKEICSFITNLSVNLFKYFEFQKECFLTSSCLYEKEKSCLAYILFQFSVSLSKIIYHEVLRQIAKKFTCDYAKIKHELFTSFPDFLTPAIEKKKNLKINLDNMQKSFEEICAISEGY